MSNPAPVSVLIAGAGPSGLTMAALLVRFGVDVTIVERYPTRRTLPKAHVINPVSLDVFQQAGFDVAAMIAQAADPRDDRVARICDRLVDRDIGVLPFERQDPSWVARQRINLPQPRLEKLLEDHVRALPSVRWVVGRWQDVEVLDGRCESSVETDAGVVRLASDYLIGSDGANSLVRERMGVEMVGPGEVQECVSVHFRADLRPWLRGREAAVYRCVDPRATGGFIAHNMDTDWVFVYFPKNDEPRDAEASRARLQLAIGTPDIDVQILAISPWKLASLVADSFRTGPVFLMGDAAHRLPPTGGLGLNTGVQDAANLAWKIGAVARGWGGDALLDSYDAERRPVAERNTAQSLENSKTMGNLQVVLGEPLATGDLGSLSDYDIASAIDDQWVGYNSPGLQLGYSYAPAGQQPDLIADRYTPSSRVGARVPHVLIRRDPAPIAVHDLIDYTQFTLLVSGDPDAWTALEGIPAPVSVLRVPPADVLDSAWLPLMGMDDTTAVLVRPDGHIAGRLSLDSAADAARIKTEVATYVSDGALFG